MNSSILNIKMKEVMMGILIIITSSSFAQTEQLIAALKSYQAGNLDSAKIYIEKATNDQETGKNSYTWHMRGFIYKDIYVKREKEDKQSPSRLESFRSFIISIGLDVTKENSKENATMIKWLAAQFKNDVVEHLNSFDSVPATEINQNQKIALSNWAQYKKAMLIFDPKMNFEKEEIEVMLGMGRLYQNVYYRSLKTNPTLLDSAKKYFIKVLTVDSSNVGANYGLATAYYNQGADIVNNTDYDIDLNAFENVVNDAKILFMKSKPLMEKSYQLQPSRPEIIIGLCNIYRALYDEEKSAQLKCRW